MRKSGGVPRNEHFYPESGRRGTTWWLGIWRIPKDVPFDADNLCFGNDCVVPVRDEKRVMKCLQFILESNALDTGNL